MILYNQITENLLLRYNIKPTDGPEICYQIANHHSLTILITSNIYLPLISNIFLIINLIIYAFDH